MTTIAYKAGIIAADTGLSGDGVKDCHASKIAKNTAGAVAGAAGDAWWIAAFLDWFRNGGEFPLMPKNDCTSAIVIEKKRVITCWESTEGTPRSYQIKAPYYAIGSGRRFALGAMCVNAHPIDAVKAAMVHDDGTYGKIETQKVGW